MHTSLWVLSFCLSIGPVETNVDQTRANDLKTAVSQLAAKEYNLRQSAMERLWAAGEAAIPHLKAALTSKDAETRYRAEFVLGSLNMGIAVDTPKSVLFEVRRFQSDQIENRRYAMRQLERMGNPKLLLGLIQGEADARLRDEWSHSLERNLVQTIAEGRIEEAADTLRRAAEEQLWMRHWSAFTVQRGSGGTELHAEPLATGESHTNDAIGRAYLMRARGEVAAACDLATQFPEDLRLALMVEGRQWHDAAKLVSAQLEGVASIDDLDVESASRAAAYYRLAGDQAKSDRWLDEIKKEADLVLTDLQGLDENSITTERELITDAWHLAKGLLLNGRYDQAIDVLSEHQPAFVFELLCEQRRYDEAFAAIGQAFPKGPSAEWFHQVARQSGNNFRNDQQFTIARRIITELCFLGERERAIEYFQILVKAAMQDRGMARLKLLCETAMKLSLANEARQLAADVLVRDDAANIVGVLFPADSSKASVWYEYYRQTAEDDTLDVTLKKVETILSPELFGRGEASIESLIHSAGQLSNEMSEARRVEWWRELAETALRYHADELAFSYLSRAAQSSPSAALRLADLYAGTGRPSEAAKWYERAWQLNPQRPLPLYLWGRSLQKLGETERGGELVERARLMPLANTDSRHELAAGLKERGFRDEARQQYEFLLCTGDFDSGKMIDASKQVGNLLHHQDELRAANCWETMLLSCLRPNWGFVENGGYVQIPQLIHKTRAKGFLKGGRPDEAVKEIWASYRAAPADRRLAEELVPLLDAAGRKADAEELFGRVLNELRELSETFNKCPSFHHDLAVLSLTCDRQVEEALAHAQQAVDLEPGKPAFLETLAEAHFRRGQANEAMVCITKCLEAEPQNAHFHRQYERFRGSRTLSESAAAR